MPSLSAQLKTLSTKITKTTRREKISDRNTEFAPRTIPSLLFDTNTAKNINFQTIFQIGSSGLNELGKTCPEFFTFEKPLFSPMRFQTVSFNRFSVSHKTIKKLDKSLRHIIRLLAPFLADRDAQKVLEFLIRFYHVHTFHAVNVLAAAIPHHKTLIFVRVVQLLKLDDKRFDFLYNGAGKAKKSGQDKQVVLPLPKQVLVRKLTKDPFFVGFIGKIAVNLSGKTKTAEVLGLSSESDIGENIPKTKFAEVFGFCADVLSDFFKSCTENEKALRSVLPTLLTALKSPLKIYFDGFVPLLSEIGRKINLSTELKNEMVKTAMKAENHKNERLAILEKLFPEPDQKSQNALNGLTLIATSINNEKMKQHILDNIAEICKKLAEPEETLLEIASESETAICKRIFAKISEEKQSFLKDRHYFERFYSQSELESLGPHWENVLNGLLEHAKNNDLRAAKPFSEIIPKIQFVLVILGNKNLNLSDHCKNTLLELALLLFLSSSDKNNDISERLIEQTMHQFTKENTEKNLNLIIEIAKTAKNDKNDKNSKNSKKTIKSLNSLVSANLCDMRADKKKETVSRLFAAYDPSKDTDVCAVFSRSFLNAEFFKHVLAKDRPIALKWAELIKTAIFQKVEKADLALVAPCFERIEDLFLLKNKACSVDDNDKICLALLESIRAILDSVWIPLGAEEEKLTETDLETITKKLSPLSNSILAAFDKSKAGSIETASEASKSRIFLKTFACVAFDVFSSISPFFLLRGARCGERSFDVDDRNFEKSLFPLNVAEIYRSIAKNEIMLIEDDSTVKHVIRFAKHCVPVLTECGLNVGIGLDVFLDQMDLIHDRRESGFEFYKTLFASIGLKKVGQEFFSMPLTSLTRRKRAIFNNLVASFGLFEQIEFAVSLLNRIRTGYLDDGQYQSLGTAKFAQEAVLAALAQWKALIPPEKDFSGAFSSFHDELHRAINAFFTFCIKNYISGENCESLKGKNGRYFLKALKSQNKVFRPKFFSENLVEILKIKKDSGNDNGEDRVVNLTKEWEFLSKFYSNFHKINKSLGTFVNSVTIINTIEKHISSEKLDAPLKLGRLLQSRLIKGAVKNDLICGESLEKITEKFENFVRSQSEKIGDASLDDKAKRLVVDVLRFMAPFFETERFVGTYSEIIKNISTMYGPTDGETDRTLPKSVFGLIIVCLNEFPSHFGSPSESILNSILKAFLDYKEKYPADKKTSVNFLAALFTAQKEFVAENCSVFADVLFLSPLGCPNPADKTDYLANKWLIIYRVLSEIIDAKHLIPALLKTFEKVKNKLSEDGLEKNTEKFSHFFRFLSHFFAQDSIELTEFDKGSFQKLYIGALDLFVSNKTFEQKVLDSFVVFVGHLSAEELLGFFDRLKGWSEGVQTIETRSLTLPMKRSPEGREAEAGEVLDKRVLFLRFAAAVFEQIGDLFAHTIETCFNVIITSLSRPGLERKVAKTDQNAAEIAKSEKSENGAADLAVENSEVDLALQLLLRFLSPVQNNSDPQSAPSKAAPALSFKRKHFDVLVDPLYKLLETEAKSRTAKNYESFAKKVMGPLTVKIAKRIVDDSEAKGHLNRTVLFYAQNESPTVRLAAIRILGRFIGVAKDQYDGLHVAVSVLCERLEDGDEKIENAARKVLKELEQITGQSMEDFMK